jgi:hypothetical protein
MKINRKIHIRKKGPGAGKVRKNPAHTAKEKLHSFMKSLSEDERREVWNIFHRQVKK